MTIDAQAVDGAFSIENISYYKDAKLATELTADADWARRGLYIGPQVGGDSLTGVNCGEESGKSMLTHRLISSSRRSTKACRRSSSPSSRSVASLQTSPSSSPPLPSSRSSAVRGSRGRQSSYGSRFPSRPFD